MIIRNLLTLGLVIVSVLGSKIPQRDYDNKNYFIFELDTSKSSQALADFIDRHEGDYLYEHQVRGLDDHFVFSIDKNHTHNQFLGNYNSNNYDHIVKRQDFEENYQELISNPYLKSIHVLKPKLLTKRAPVTRDFKAVDSSQKPIQDAVEKLGIQDPIFPEQWHILNANYPGNDVNVTGLWYEGITGKGVVTAVVDDGLDYESEDLKNNFNSTGSWDYNDNTELPKPRLFNDYHGTRCAGEIAAGKNQACGVGVAYDGQVSGIRILSKIITAEDEAAAMMYRSDVNDIYSCSWGPNDDGKTLGEPEKVVKQAIIKGVQEGRQKKGSIYVFASGNGGRSDDSCNFDGYTNSIYSITVGAIDHKGLHPSYAEACSAVMVVTYSSGSAEHIHTTDIHGKCSAAHGGTSAAAPLAAGIFSLILQTNPNLTWRDLQYVAALSSVPVNEDDGHYQITALKRKYSHKYGYGKIDAYQMAQFAKTWTNVKPQAWFYSDVVPVNENIDISGPTSDQKSKVIKLTLIVNHRELEVMNVERVEHVTVTVNIKSTFRGQVGARLTSPFGIVSDLATFRPRDTSGEGFDNWTFSSVAHWGESGIGEWVLEVFNNPTTQGNKIEVVDWQLRLFGESKDADAAETYDIDKDYAQVRRDRIVKLKDPTTTSTAQTTEKTPETTEKPVEKPKTTEAKTTEAKTTEKPTETPTTTAAKTDHATTSSAVETLEPEEEDDGGTKQATTDHAGLYLISLVVVGFAVIVLIMKFHKTPGSSRRRRRRDEYEFDIIPGEDYSDSEDMDSHDSLDLGSRNDDDFNADEERDRLYDEFNAEALPDYEQDEEIFKIGDADDEPKKDQKKKVNFEDGGES